ncbi:MAG: alpha/beta fold hydrolase, partial [Anaerolineaceae bacterium]
MQYIKNPHLDGKSFFLSGNKIGFLLIHGYTASTTEVRLLGEKLHKDKFTVSAPLLPGHLTTPDDMNRCSWKDWYGMVEKSYLDLQEKVDTIFVVGESLGALLTLLLARKQPGIAGLLCYAPALIIPRVWMSHFLFPFVKYLPKDKKEDGLAWKGYTVNPIHAIAQVNIIQKQVSKALPGITTPIAIFQSENDKAVDPRGADMVYNNIGSKDKEIHWFNESAHCMI